jgi:ABC-type ATPase with predicted acetyltransferase domain
MNIYTFYLSRDYTPTPIQVYPIWKDDLAIEYEMEQGQRFYRRELSGSLTFVGKDFDWINGTAFDALFTLEIRVSRNNGLTWEV